MNSAATEQPDGAGPGDATGKPTFNERLRRRYFGRPRPDAEAPADDSVLSKGNQMGFFGRVDRPGGFDRPPVEPIELDGGADLPWELGGPAPEPGASDKGS